MEIFSAIILLVIFLLTVLSQWRRSSLPPGPRGYPIVGSLYSLGPKSIPGCQRFKKLADRYGPIMFLRMGSRPTVVISSHTAAREFFSSEHDKNFDSRPQFATGKHFGYNYSSTVFSSGKQFEHMKKIYKVELLSPTNVKKLAPLRLEENRVLLREILGLYRGGESVMNVTSVVFKANLNLMGRMIFSQRLFGGKASAVDTPPPIVVENFKYFVKSATKLVGLFNIGDYIPLLRWLDLQGNYSSIVAWCFVFLQLFVAGFDAVSLFCRCGA